MGRKSSSNVAVFVRLFLIVAMAMVCVLTFCSCDTKDVESLFQPSDFTVTFVLNNGEENVIWRKGDAVPTPQKKDFLVFILVFGRRPYGKNQSRF